MTNNLKRLRRWIQNPRFYAAQARRRWVGEENAFLADDRDDHQLGSRQWLALSELRYGGIQLPIEDKERLARGEKISGVQGGDRMTPRYHDYGRWYAKFLASFIPQRDDLTLVEVGILNGSGLAIWCDLFSRARVVGLDLNLDNYHANRSELINAGAFTKNQPEVHAFDQLDRVAGDKQLRQLFENQRIDVVIDDGAHTLESIESTFAMMQPLLSKQFVYFVEDNYDTCRKLSPQFPQYRWLHLGQLTVCLPK